jgi:preprotein translocase subunit SecA
MSAFRVEDLPIESQMLTKALDEAQRKVENYFFDIRKQLFEYDEVLNSQRDRVYAERRRALVSDSLESLIVEYAELTMDDILEVNNIKKCHLSTITLSDEILGYSYHLKLHNQAELFFVCKVSKEKGFQPVYLLPKSCFLFFQARPILVLIHLEKAGIWRS